MGRTRERCRGPIRETEFVRGILGRGRRGRERTIAMVVALTCCGSGALAAGTALAQTPQPPGGPAALEVPSAPATSIRPPDPGTTAGGVLKNIADAARPVADSTEQTAGAAANTATSTTGQVIDALGQTTSAAPLPAGGALPSAPRRVAQAP